MNFNYIENSKRELSVRDVQIAIFPKFLYFQIYQILIFPEVWKIMKHWKYATLKNVEILNTKVTYISRVECMSYMYVCMYACTY